MEPAPATAPWLPPGEAKRRLDCTVHRNALLRGRRVAKLATPTEHGESRRCIPFIPRHSLSFAFAQQLPQRGSQGHFVPGELRVAKVATPTEHGESRRCIPFIPRHSLSFAFAQQLPQRGSQGHFVPAGGYEPPLLVRRKPGMQRGRTPYAECALVTAAPSCSADIHFDRRK